MQDPEELRQYRHRDMGAASNQPRHAQPRYAWQRDKGVLLEPNQLRQSRNPRQKQSRSSPNHPQRSEIGVCTKYFLFIQNFFTFIIGAAATSLGIYILVLKDKPVPDAIGFFMDPSCDMCLAGSIILVMSFLGLYGSLRENKRILKIYYYLMILFLVLEIVLCILIFATYLSPKMKEALVPKDAFDRAIKNYRDDIDMQNFIDSMQTELKCCGMSDSEVGFLDWNNNTYFSCTPNNPSPERCSVPASCCVPQPGKIVNHQCGWKAFQMDMDGHVIPNDKLTNMTDIYREGCMKAVGDWINNHALVVGGFLLGLLLPQIVDVVLASNLINMIRKQKSRWTKTTDN